MRFIVGQPPINATPLTAYLKPDSWDDWFEFETLHNLVIFDANGKYISIGDVKIGQIAQSTRKPQIPSEFELLGDEFFSIGQDENYYETLYALEPDLRDSILVGLRDCASDLDRFERALPEKVMSISLLRSVDEKKVRNRFRAILNGNAPLSAFDIEYSFPPLAGTESIALFFSIRPNATPPTNIHVIIGRNGVGKTRCFRLMGKALTGGSSDENGEFTMFNSLEHGKIANVVSVAFSAFDPFEPVADGYVGKANIRFNYVGLRRFLPRRDEATVAPDQTSDVPLKTPEDLTDEFIKSLLRCASAPRLTRWRDVVGILATDPLFEEAEILTLLDSEDSAEISLKAGSTFRRLSSGHKIVLFTLTRLVELVEERTLVLIDEPEAHLHPPLLSSLMRALSFLLVKRNGVSIIATHSPVVLQETPSSCVWLMDRSGTSVVVRRPEIETFGGNVGALTREVFDLEVTHSGFHKLIRDVCHDAGSYDEVLRRFNNQLGAEGRSLAKTFFISPEQPNA